MCNPSYNSGLFCFYNGMPNGMEKPNSCVMEKHYKEMIELAKRWDFQGRVLWESGPCTTSLHTNLLLFW